MIDEARQEEAIRYVLGEMPEAEAAQFAAQLDQDAELRQFVAEISDSAASLALSVPAVVPPPAVLENLLAEIRPLGNAPDESGSIDAPEPKFVRFPWLPWALAASLAIVAGVLGFKGRETNAGAEKRIRELTAQVEDYQKKDALAQVRIATLGAQVKEYESTVAVIVWDSENQRGQLKLAQLPPLEKDKDYQLWVIDPSYDAPVSAGVIAVAPDGVSRMAFNPIQPIRGANQFAISIERKGGSSAPQGQIVLAGK